MKELYDVITKKSIFFNEREVKKQSILMELDQTVLTKVLNKKYFQAYGRYILPENKNKIFTLIDLDTGKEYDCITNRTIFIYFGKPRNIIESQAVYNLVNKKISYASICGKIFYLKNENGIIPNLKTTRFKNKNLSNFIQQKIKDKKFKVKIKNKLSTRIFHALKTKNLKKNNKTEQLIGCTIEFFIGYIEGKFVKNMSWNNYGEWHIDHIKPCASFDLTQPDQQKQCFHYINLQPLWATTKIAQKNGDFISIGNLNKNDKMVDGLASSQVL